MALWQAVRFHNRMLVKFCLPKIAGCKRSLISFKIWLPLATARRGNLPRANLMLARAICKTLNSLCNDRFKFHARNFGASSTLEATKMCIWCFPRQLFLVPTCLQSHSYAAPVIIRKSKFRYKCMIWIINGTFKLCFLIESKWPYHKVQDPKLFV